MTTTSSGPRPVLGPDGQPESYTWLVQYRNAEILCEIDIEGGPDRTWSRDVRTADVEWIILVPQYSGLNLQRVLVPPGAAAHFARTRSHVGNPASGQQQAEPRFATSIGWRLPDGSGSTLLLDAEGSTWLGADQNTLLRELERE